jgi:hypothetical protein
MSAVDIVTWIDGIGIGYFCGILTALFIFNHYHKTCKYGE